MTEVVTEGLEKALNNELESIGSNNIKLAMQQIVREGTTYHNLKLKSRTYSNVNVSSVLSEGEQCAVAIASFLAEIKISNYKSGIVFDDPVSSLDHKWRHSVAKRLVKEGLNRQVIIFTHDIVFLLAIQDEATKQRVPLVTHNIREGPLGFGTCEPDNLPWEAMKVKNRVNHLLNKQKLAAREYNAKKFDKYRVAAQECYDLLRQSWERAVEEVLFNKVIERFGPEVKTQSLKGVSVTDDDFVRIYRAMTECSEYLHDMAAAQKKPLPTPDEIKQSIESLGAFVDEIKKRRNSVENDRKHLIKPPSSI